MLQIKRHIDTRLSSKGFFMSKTNTQEPEALLINEIRSDIAQELGFTPEQLPPQLTPKQTAQVLGVKTTTLSVWRSTGRYDLPFIKIAKSPRYRVTDIARFIAKHRFSHSGQAQALQEA